MMKNYSIVCSTPSIMTVSVLAKNFDEAVKIVKKMYPNATIESVAVDLF